MGLGDVRRLWDGSGGNWGLWMERGSLGLEERQVAQV